MSSAVSVIICLSSCSTCAEISGARNAAAMASFGLPRMPIALPTSFDQPFGNRVMSYTILGNATCLMHWTYIEYSLLMAIWFGMASVSGLSPWHEPRTRFQHRCVTGYSR